MLGQAHPLPGHPVALAAAPQQRPVPAPRDLFPDRTQHDAAREARHGGVPAHHAAQPLSLLWDGPVTALHEQGVHLTQLGRHSLRDRLAPQREPPRSRLPAHVREAEEVERLGEAEPRRLRFWAANRPNSIRRVFSAFSSRLEPGKTLHQVRLEPLSVGAMLKTGSMSSAKRTMITSPYDFAGSASAGPTDQRRSAGRRWRAGGMRWPLAGLPPRLRTTDPPRSLPRSAISG